MKLLQLFKDESAVSPVIGVVLMVAIVVILSAIVGTAVLSIGNDAQQVSPQVNVQFDYDESNTEVSIMHKGGDDIQTSNIRIAETGDSDDISTSGSGEVAAGEEIASGAYQSGETISVAWESDDGSTSVILAQSEAP
jgi:flagellin-like protein